MTPELQSKISLWRAKATDGTLTEAEMIEAIKAIRETRLSAMGTSAPAKKPSARKPSAPSGDDLLSELGDL